VIQFPGRKKDGETPESAAKPAAATPPAAPKKKKGSAKNLGATAIAVMLGATAVNRYVYSGASNSADLSSTGRHIASVSGELDWKRDADWEKRLAESLASARAREVASLNIGRPATKEEKLRWGALEEKYTITYKTDRHEINGILLQDPATNPAYVLDRPKFLSEFGTLFEGSFADAKLKSVESSDDKTVESYTLYDKDHRARGEARFELDRHKRLISLKVEPVNI
jgi:hypothetical protein